MNRLARRSISAATELLTAAVLFLLHYTDILNISVFGARPMILLPFLVALSMYREELHSAVAGGLVGIFSDSVASGASCFNTILFFLLCFLTALATHYLLNNNLKTAIMLAVVWSLIYYFFRWLLFFAFTGSANSIEYLMQYAIPSVIYTAVFILPLYYWQRFIFRFRTKGDVK